MSVENQKWSENVPEVISEGLKFKKIFLGAMPPDPPTEYAVTCSPFAPPNFT